MHWLILLSVLLDFAALLLVIQGVRYQRRAFDLLSAVPREYDHRAYLDAIARLSRRVEDLERAVLLGTAPRD